MLNVTETGTHAPWFRLLEAPTPAPLLYNRRFRCTQYNFGRNQAGQFESDVDFFQDSPAELHTLCSNWQSSPAFCSSGGPRIKSPPVEGAKIKSILDLGPSTLAYIPTLPLPLEPRDQKSTVRFAARILPL
jgi:hypothetical protein